MMKSTKKLLLLLLSVMLLIGTFAVASAASTDDAGVLTIKYANGTVQTYAEGETVEPIAVPADYAAVVDGAAYKFTVAEGAVWTYSEALPETVTSADLGKTITATVDGTLGTEQVYFTVAVTDGATTYYTDATQLLAYLKAMDIHGSTVTLYADASIAPAYWKSKQVESSAENKALTESAVHNFDLNGHTLSFTGSGTAIVFRADVYIYSSKPNGKIDASSHTLFYTDNDEYKCIGGVVYGTNWKNTETGETYKTLNATVMNPSADAVLGEPYGVSDTYGDNLTVVCQKINGKMYGGSAYLKGGTYVQSESSTASYLLLMSREDADYFVVGNVENVTLVTTRIGTAPLFYRPMSDRARTFTNCNFISTAEGCVPLSVWETPSGTGTFNDCNFYNVLPFFPENGKAFTYTDCRFGTSGTVLGTDLDPTGSEVYLAYVKDGSAITANGETYVMNLSCETAKNDLKTVTWQDGTISYFKAETLDDAKMIVGAIPMANASTAPYTFFENNLMYYVAEPNVTGTYDEATLNAVFADAAKENAAQVYYTTEQNGVITYVTEDAEAALAALLKELPDGNMDIVLRSDMKIPGTIIRSRKGYKYYLDINGYTLTIASSEGRSRGAFQVCTTFAFYSSREGGVIDASACQNGFVWTNDTEGYYSKNYAESNKDGAGPAIIGERDTNATANGKNLTILCGRVLSDPLLSGSGVYIVGGTFVQTNRATTSFLYETQRLSTIKNATFVLSSPSTVAIQTLAHTFTGCTFVFEGEGFANTVADTCAYALTFNKCTFINVLPVYSSAATVTYTDCSFGTTGFFPSASLNGAGAYLAHTGTSVNVEANGVIYAVDGVLVTALDGYTLVIWKDAAGVFGTEYWADGVTVTVPAGLKRIDKENECTWLDPSVTTAAEGDGITATVTWGTKDGWAFSYLIGGETYYVYLSDCGNTEEGVGDMFYALFDQLDNTYVVTLYSDLLLTQGMGMGLLGTSSTASGPVPHYNSMQLGDFTLDLNGHTFKTSADFVGIDGSNSNSSSSYGTYASGVFCFEVESSKTFKVTSSRPGARFEHNANCAIFCVGEQGSVKLVIEGENITFDSLGAITMAFETGQSILPTLDIDGGTFIYRGKKAAFAYLNSATIDDATILLTGKTPFAVFGYHTYKRHAAMTVTNTKIYSVNQTGLFSFVSSSMAAATGMDGYTYSLTLDGCTFAGVTLPASVKALDTLTYTGTTLSDNADYLLVAYKGEQPANTVLAYSNGVFGKYTAKLMGYYAEDAVGTVDWGFDLDTEYWALGSVATRENALIAETFIYAFNPTAVDAETVHATYYIAGVESGKLRMNLTLQSEIGVNLLIAEALSGATVTLGNEAEAVLAGLVATDGYYTLTTVLAPTEANAKITVKVVLDGITHTFTLSIESYAAVILASEAYADAHNLTFAMVKYVQAMTEDESFCESLSAPEGYEEKTLASTPYEKADGNALLTGIAFQLDKNIAVAVAGEKGTEVALALKNGRTETVTIGTNGEAIFESLYVNEFFGTLTITAGNETYTYSLENYLNAMETDHPEKVSAIKALYIYTYYANDYVENVLNQVQ